MINEEATFRWKGYHSSDLHAGSGSKVWAVCEGCGYGRWVKFSSYRDFCISCAKKGKNNPNYNKHHSKETIEKIRKSNEGKTRSKTHCRRISNSKIGKRLSEEHKKKLSEIRKGVPKTEEHRKNISAAQKGEEGHGYGKRLSEETRKKISIAGLGRRHSDHARKKISDARKGIIFSIETRRKISDSLVGRFTGKDSPSWKGGVSFEPYCPKFNESCKEHNREKYTRMCFICGKDEVFNGSRLSVHHVDRNKYQGCDNHQWSLVPLCKKHHGSCHNDLWESRIMYLLDHVW